MQAHFPKSMKNIKSSNIIPYIHEKNICINV